MLYPLLPLLSGWIGAEVWGLLANSVPGLGAVFSGICLKGERGAAVGIWERHGEGVGARKLFSSGTGETVLVGWGKSSVPGHAR